MILRMEETVKTDIFPRVDKTAAKRRPQTETQRNGSGLEARSSRMSEDELCHELKKLVASNMTLATSWSEWRDSNPRPHGPEPCAIPSFATPRNTLFHYRDLPLHCQGRTSEKKNEQAAQPAHSFWRRHPDLNWGIRILQTLALPLGYGADSKSSLC